MSEPNITAALKHELVTEDGAKLTLFAKSLVDLAIDKNTAAMKLVVDLVEPDRKQELERRLTDEELLERLDRLYERTRPQGTEVDRVPSPA
jgi:hypothetical protein